MHMSICVYACKCVRVHACVHACMWLIDYKNKGKVQHVLSPWKEIFYHEDQALTRTLLAFLIGKDTHEALTTRSGTHGLVPLNGVHGNVWPEDAAPLRRGLRCGCRQLACFTKYLAVRCL